MAFKGRRNQLSNGITLSFPKEKNPIIFVEVVDCLFIFGMISKLAEMRKALLDWERLCRFSAIICLVLCLGM